MSRKSPAIHSVMLLRMSLYNDTVYHNGTWVPRRLEASEKEKGLKDRLRAAWLVFTGKADAIIWPGQ